MIIDPIIKGVIARSAHPMGCKAALEEQIHFAKNSKPILNAPKRVLVLGASSGLGLAARIALTFGGAKADTIGVSFEHAPSEKGVGSAGWYNNIHFKNAAENEGQIAININGDTFSQETRDQVIEAIETYFEGEVDLIIYSIATGVRPKPANVQTDANDKFWRSSIKPIGEPLDGTYIDLATDSWSETTIEPATQQEIDETIQVMGGADWESWVDTLINAESIAQGCQTVAFSYIGSDQTHAIYRDGTLGWAKVDLHQASHSLNLKLANFDGSAHACVCKALVTKASVFIPSFIPYMIALTQVMKDENLDEDCIAQMQRLFRDKVFHDERIDVDSERLIRMDDWEMSPTVQSKVKVILEQMNADNFKEIADYQGFKQSFMQLNGFGFEHIDYTQPIDLSEY